MQKVKRVCFIKQMILFLRSRPGFRLHGKYLSSPGLSYVLPTSRIMKNILFLLCLCLAVGSYGYQKKVHDYFSYFSVSDDRTGKYTLPATFT